MWHKEEKRLKQLNQGVVGAHMCIPLQCESCWIYNIEKREMEDTPDDWEYAKCIRRCNLDAINGKAPSTIRGHRREVLSTVRYCSRIGKTPSFEPRGPMPVDDNVGMSVAVEMQLKSLFSKGRINPDYSQYDTIRKVRATASKTYDSSARGVGEQASFSQGKASRIRPTECPSQSEWFQDFARGMQNRMGYESAADHGVGMRAIVKLLEYIKADALDLEAEESMEEANQLFKIGAFICAVTVGSLRGYEGFFMDLAGMISHLDKGREGEVPEVLHANLQALLSEEMCSRLPHITLCLLGNFKGEGGIGYHMINVANETTSGLQTRWWMEKLVKICQSEGRVSGPAFADKFGNLASSVDYDAVFRKYLNLVQSSTDLIPEDINVDTHYSLNRTPRKSSLTRAKRANLHKEAQEEMNRWRTVEHAKTRRPRFNMRHHYSESCLLMPTTWLYSYAL